MLDLVLMAVSGSYCYVADKGCLQNIRQADLPVKIGVAAFGSAAAFRILKTIFGRSFTDHLTFLKTVKTQEQRRNIKVDDMIDGYNALHHNSDYVKEGDKAGVEERESKYKALVNAYYELATVFYEWGWGQCFHFATLNPRERFIESIRRHEYYLAGKLGIRRGQKVLDCGCGVGGPGRNIAAFTGAQVTGVTLNEYQVQRGNDLSRVQRLDHLYRSVQGDFMNLQFADNEFDAVFAIEATCHAPQRSKCFQEINRVMRPGGMFATYEWVLTEKYDAANAEHRWCKKKIEEGDGLPDLLTAREVDQALEIAGFEILETEDVALYLNPGDIPWYVPMTPSWNIFSQRFQFTPIGLSVTPKLLWVLELLRLAPRGTYKVQTMLQQAALGLGKAGQQGTFTAMYLCVCRKPL
jgi:sterol 24-C-methyltransferase